MRQGQDGCTPEIEIVAQGLIDGGLERGPTRAAAERQSDGEAGEAQHEDQAGDACERAPQGGPFDQAKNRAAIHAELAGKTPALSRHGFERREKCARGKWHVEKDMGDQDARESVEQAAGG